MRQDAGNHTIPRFLASNKGECKWRYGNLSAPVFYAEYIQLDVAFGNTVLI